MDTSACTLLSTVHGRDRRALRQIGKKDLQAAVRHGRKERSMVKTANGWQWTGRWKYTFANIVYVTDCSSRVEITSWVLPLVIDPVPVTALDQRRHEEEVMQLRQRPGSCTSHLVFVADQSGSMRTCDVEDFKTRSDAVFGSIALDILGQQIDQHGCRKTDVVSLIEMRAGATTVFEREPMTNVLFNKLLQRKQRVRPEFHGNYLPALEEAARLLSQDKGSGTCALMLIFLSDGRPSDHVTKGGGTAQIAAKVEELAARLGSQLTVGTIGFGGGEGDFTVLKAMAAAATAAGAHGSFAYAGRSSATLSSLVSSLGTRLSATRSRIAGMTSVAGARHGKTPRPQPAPAPCRPAAAGDAIDAEHWQLFGAGSERRHVEWTGKAGGWQRVPFYTAGVPSVDGLGIALHRSELGRGAERVVYCLRQFTQSDAGAGAITPVGEKLVAKESLYLEDDDMREDFHLVFCKTQQQARHFARRFSQRVDQVFAMRRWLVPATLSFLPCSVYVLGGRGYLVEKMLDRSKWCKWNTNAGSVLGAAAANPPRGGGGDVDEEDEGGAVPFQLPAIAEGSDSEGNDGGGDDDEPHDAAAPEAVPQDLISPSDFPQAFSHFTYRDSRRQRLVCDLQGTLDASVCPARYELTDPAIHHASRSGRSRVYGRTDHGQKGISRFFQSHQCNALCKLLGLPPDR